MFELTFSSPIDEIPNKERILLEIHIIGHN